VTRINHRCTARRNGCSVW